MNRKRPIWQYVLFGLLAIGIIGSLLNNDTEPNTAAIVPDSTSSQPEPSSESVSEKTPAQLIAIIDDKSGNDPEIATQFAKTEEVCPENGSKLADILTNMYTEMEKMGKPTGMMEVMQSLINASPNEMGTTCVNAGALIVTLMDSQ